jgi:hypothetical protein
MEWIIEYLDEAADDLNKLDHSQQLHVLKPLKRFPKLHCPLTKGEWVNP